MVFELPSVQWHCGLKVSAESQFLRRFERSKAVERLEPLVLNGAKRWDDWNDWNWLLFRLTALLPGGTEAFNNDLT